MALEEKLLREREREKEREKCIIYPHTMYPLLCDSAVVSKGCDDNVEGAEPRRP